MKHVSIFCSVLLSLLSIHSLEAEPLDSLPYFKAVTGNWIGEGEMTTKDGTTIPIRETWKGATNSEGAFTVTGERQWGDQTQQFSWTFTHNSATELIECEYTHTGMEAPLKLNVSLTDVQVIMTAQLGQSGGELTITNVISGDSIHGNVLAKDGTGIETLQGNVTHNRTGD